VQQAIAAQELSLTRLAVGIVEHEDDDVFMEKIGKSLHEATAKRQLARDRLEAFRAHVEVTVTPLITEHIHIHC
jgi:transcriptional regulator NrdR family protein